MEGSTREPRGTGTVWSPWTGVLPAPLRKLLGFGVFLAAFYAAYHLGMAFSPQLSAPFWFPDAVLLCALLCTRRSWWWLLLLLCWPCVLTTRPLMLLL